MDGKEWIEYVERMGKSERRAKIATAALQGILARSYLDRGGPEITWYTREAVRFADALLAELNKGTQA